MKKESIGLRDTLKWLLVSWLPRWLIEACIVRAWAEFEPRHSWEVRESVSVWRMYEEWVRNSHLREVD